MRRSADSPLAGRLLSRRKAERIIVCAGICENIGDTLRNNIYFKVITPLNKEIRITKEYWDFVKTIKHPNMEGKEKEIIETLRNPEFIRKSKKDDRVYLYYKSAGNYYLCVACKHLNGDGFIITTYITNRLKEGEEIWRKS